MRWHRFRLPIVVVGLAAVLLACGGGDDAENTTATESSGETAPTASSQSPVTPVRTTRTGGMGTAFDATSRSFSLTARNINHYQRQLFADGKTVFEMQWTPTGDEFGGLGPFFDAAACSSCHLEDGRAAGPSGDGPLPLGIGVQLTSDDPLTIDRVGDSLASNGIDGGEAVVRVDYETVTGTFDDGEPYELRRPVYSVEIDGDPLPDDAILGIRVAPQLPGMGLLEQISASDLNALADPDDADGDGVSGRLSIVTNLLTGEETIGRFGWNAGQPSVEQQAASAFFHDMGLTTRYFPSQDCDRWVPCVREGAPLSEDYDAELYGDPNAGLEPIAEVEVSDRQLFEVTAYTQTLAVPGPRDLGDPQIEQGWDLFGTVGCSSCHTGGYTTENGPVEGLSDELIQPYTDLLLHDLGIGLSDTTVAGDPVPTEWRTPPLWGIGLLETVSGHTDLLHDGRARNYEEAILWHDGEAAASAAAYRALPVDERAAVLAFLESI